MDQQAIMDMYAQMLPTYCVSIAVSYVLSAIAYMKIFEKAGVTTWYAWVPILNTYWITKIATGNGWLFLIALIPCVGPFIYLILMGIKLSKAFGCGGGMTALLIIPFTTIIGFYILGFGSAQYQGPQ